MRKRDKQPPKTKKYFRSTESGAGMTKAGVAKYRRDNPGSKLKTAVTGKVKKGSKAANRRNIRRDKHRVFDGGDKFDTANCICTKCCC
jgi:hypothetical protein